MESSFKDGWQVSPIQQVIHKGLAFILRQAIPIQSALDTGLTQLDLSKSQSFLPAALQLAKVCEVLIERSLEVLAKRRRKEQEKLRMLREVVELFKTDWPKRT